MDYIELNNIHRAKMKGTCHNTEHFEWEDSNFIDYLKGGLPRLYNVSSDSKIKDLVSTLRKNYESYSFFNSDSHAFIEEIGQNIEDIRKVEPYWHTS